MATRQASPGIGHPTEAESGLLRSILKLDAVATGAVGALMVVAASMVIGDERPLALFLGIPAVPLASVGTVLIAFAAFVWIIGSRRRVHRAAVRTVVAINLAYVVGCIALVASGLSLTAPGVAFVLAQAAAVALFAVVQSLGLRRSQPISG